MIYSGPDVPERPNGAKDEIKKSGSGGAPRPLVHEYWLQKGEAKAKGKERVV